MKRNLMKATTRQIEILPRMMIFEISSRLTHEHFDFPSSATNRKGPCYNKNNVKRISDEITIYILKDSNKVLYKLNLQPSRDQSKSKLSRFHPLDLKIKLIR